MLTVLELFFVPAKGKRLSALHCWNLRQPTSPQQRSSSSVADFGMPLFNQCTFSFGRRKPELLSRPAQSINYYIGFCFCSCRAIFNEFSSAPLKSSTETPQPFLFYFYFSWPLLSPFSVLYETGLSSSFISFFCYYFFSVQFITPPFRELALLFSLLLPPSHNMTFPFSSFLSTSSFSTFQTKSFLQFFLLNCLIFYFSLI